MSTVEIKLFEILKTKLGEKEAEALVELVDYRIKEANEQDLKGLATKEDITKLEIKLIEKIAEAKIDLIKWTFGFFIVIMLAVIGLYFKH